MYIYDSFVSVFVNGNFKPIGVIFGVKPPRIYALQTGLVKWRLQVPKQLLWGRFEIRCFRNMEIERIKLFCHIFPCLSPMFENYASKTIYS